MFNSLVLLLVIKSTFKEEDPANIKAAEKMGKLHDRLKEIGYTGHDSGSLFGSNCFLSFCRRHQHF